MTEGQLRELFKATNTEEPLAGGWPGLLRYGMAVAEACAKECDNYTLDDDGKNNDARLCALAIRKRSNAKEPR